MKKAVGYIRYGNGKRDEERQRNEIGRYCAESGYQVIDWIGKGMEDFGDVAYGKWMRNRKVDAVVVASAADVTENVYEYYAYKCKLRIRNSDLVCASEEGFAGHGLYRKIFEEFADTYCRMEIEHEYVRNENGRMRKVSKGGYIGGQPPMGYRVEDGRLVVNEAEVPVVLMIMERKHSGKTMLSTVDALNQNGYRTRKGGKFVISTVQSIWNNENFYRGMYRYGKDGEWVPGQHEAILKD